jgi:hypothetical protein
MPDVFRETHTYDVGSPVVGMFAFFPLKFPWSRFFAHFVKVPNYKAAGARDGG